MSDNCFDILDRSYVLTDGENVIPEYTGSLLGMTVLVLPTEELAQRMLKSIQMDSRNKDNHKAYKILLITDSWHLMRELSEEGFLGYTCVEPDYDVRDLMIKNRFVFAIREGDVGAERPTLLIHDPLSSPRQEYFECLSRGGPLSLKGEQVVPWARFDLCDKASAAALDEDMVADCIFPMNLMDQNWLEHRQFYEVGSYHSLGAIDIGGEQRPHSSLMGKWLRAKRIVPFYTSKDEFVYDLIDNVISVYTPPSDPLQSDLSEHISAKSEELIKLIDQEFKPTGEDLSGKEYREFISATENEYQQTYEFIRRVGLHIKPIPDIKSRIIDIFEENKDNPDISPSTCVFAINPRSSRLTSGYIKDNHVVNIYGLWKIMPGNHFEKIRGVQEWNGSDSIGWSGGELFQFAPVKTSLHDNTHVSYELTIPMSGFEAEDSYSSDLDYAAVRTTDLREMLLKSTDFGKRMDLVVRKSLSVETYLDRYFIFDQFAWDIGASSREMQDDLPFLDDNLKMNYRDEETPDEYRRNLHMLQHQIEENGNYYSRTPDTDVYANQYFLSYWTTLQDKTAAGLYMNKESGHVFNVKDSFEEDTVYYPGEKVEYPLIVDNFLTAVVWLANYELQYDRHFRINGANPHTVDFRRDHLSSANIQALVDEENSSGEVFQSALRGIAIKALMDGYQPKYSHDLVLICNRLLQTLTLNFAGYGKDLLIAVNDIELPKLISFLGIGDDKHAKFMSDWELHKTYSQTQIDPIGAQAAVRRMGENSWLKLGNLSKHFVATALSVMEEWGYNHQRDYAPISLEIVKTLEVELASLFRAFKANIECNNNIINDIPAVEKSLFSFVYNDTKPPTLGQMEFFLRKPNSKSSNLRVSFYKYIEALPNGKFILSKKFRDSLSKAIYKYRNGGAHDSKITYETCAQAFDVIVGNETNVGILVRLLEWRV